MSSRTPRKVAVSVDVTSFEHGVSLMSWRGCAAALRGKEYNCVGRDTGVKLRQQMHVMLVTSVAPLVFGADLFFDAVKSARSSTGQSLMSGAISCAL